MTRGTRVSKPASGHAARPPALTERIPDGASAIPAAPTFALAAIEAGKAVPADPPIQLARVKGREGRKYYTVRGAANRERQRAAATQVVEQNRERDVTPGADGAQLPALPVPQPWIDDGVHDPVRAVPGYATMDLYNAARGVQNVMRAQQHARADPLIAPHVPAGEGDLNLDMSDLASQSSSVLNASAAYLNAADGALVASSLPIAQRPAAPRLQVTRAGQPVGTLDESSKGVFAIDSDAPRNAFLQTAFAKPVGKPGTIYQSGQGIYSPAAMAQGGDAEAHRLLVSMAEATRAAGGGVAQVAGFHLAKEAGVTSTKALFGIDENSPGFISAGYPGSQRDEILTDYHALHGEYGRTQENPSGQQAEDAMDRLRRVREREEEVNDDSPQRPKLRRARSAEPEFAPWHDPDDPAGDRSDAIEPDLDDTPLPSRARKRRAVDGFLTSAQRAAHEADSAANLAALGMGLAPNPVHLGLVQDPTIEQRAATEQLSRTQNSWGEEAPYAPLLRAYLQPSGQPGHIDHRVQTALAEPEPQARDRAARKRTREDMAEEDRVDETAQANDPMVIADPLPVEPPAAVPGRRRSPRLAIQGQRK